jgi:hypothetical protein
MNKRISGYALDLPYQSPLQIVTASLHQILLPIRRSAQERGKE